MPTVEQRTSPAPEPLLLAAVAASPLPILTLDREGIVTSWNAAAERMFGWTAQEVLGRPLPTVPPDRWEEFLDLNERVLQGEAVAGAERRRQRKDGSLLDLSISTAPLYDDMGRICGAMAVYVDMTERKRLEEALRRQASHDPLTQVPNRLLLQDRLEHSLHSAHRNRSSLALLVIDLDHFKEVNDCYGHQMGDSLLQHVARRLELLLRASDTLARLGGDEFAILLPETEERGAIEVARKISEALAGPFLVDHQAVHVEPSIGMSLYPQHGTDAVTLLRRADQAMYLAKRAKSQWAVFPADQEE